MDSVTVCYREPGTMWMMGEKNRDDVVERRGARRMGKMRKNTPTIPTRSTVNVGRRRTRTTSLIKTMGTSMKFKGEERLPVQRGVWRAPFARLWKDPFLTRTHDGAVPGYGGDRTLPRKSHSIS